ncbi:tyrosine-type recombinase/integrase [Pseudonocardia halophobica]|uniref:tyrosine-type recombinase/integrase n=1 Tax=Pseudonocardia halophobica TaxID=29401 RepID=UPI003D919C59
MESYTTPSGQERHRGRPRGINPEKGKRWPSKAFDAWRNADWYDRYPEGGGTTPPPWEAHNALYGAVAAPTARGAGLRPIALGAFCDSWLERHNVDGQPTSQRSRAAQVRKIQESALADMVVSAINVGDVKAFLASVVGGESTVQARLSVLRAVLDAAVDEGYAARNPARGQGVKIQTGNRRPKAREITRDEWALIVKALPEWLRAAAVLSTYCGLRAGEVCGLKWESVNFETNRILVRDVILEGGVERDRPKYGEAKAIPMTPEVAEILKAHRSRVPGKRADYVFRDPDSGRRFLTPADVRYRWKMARKAAFVGVDGMEPVAARWHDLRHMFAQDLVTRGVPLMHVMRLMRHAKVATTQRYTWDPEVDDLAVMMNTAPIAV